ncbi:PepSY domain-containing protein [Shewanella sp. AS1]|uniref:PepSY-associated TM helix domain-containing protein n=1 Tax=Shewanella sp. AS1 TaxID=2907626 RepID=UPI001F3B3626|nr:PepSY-associated TM helix domain-containing protein [Shewanella sp. AS1]MCE9679323.1 PepSY domain-containing protein [Shewanella sp. AS1]
MKIRADILRTYQSIHTWTGIIAGLVLFIAFYAGSLTMFKPQITQWATPPTEQLQQIEASKYDQLIAEVIGEHDMAREGFIINFDEQSSPMLWYEKGGGRGYRLDDQLIHASFSGSGELITKASGKNELGTLIDQLHRTAGIPGEVGHEELGVLVLGLASILYFIALISGIIFLLPTLVKTLFALRSKKGANRFWLDSHNLAGVLSFPFHVIIALTVVAFAFHDLFYGGLTAIYGDKPMFEPRARSAVEYKIEQLAPISTYLEKVSDIPAGYQVKSMEFSGLSSPMPSLAISITSEGTMTRGAFNDFIYMNPYTYDVQINTISAMNEGNYPAIVATFFGLHFGNYAGDFGRWLYFVMGLVGAFLFYSGNLLWLEKRRQKQPQQTRSSRFMGALTVGVCLGSLLGVAVTMFASRWIYLLDGQINYAYLACYYLSFIVAVIYSFARGAAIAAIGLLKLTAVSCLLIPATSILALLLPNIGIWAPHSFSGLLIEIFALFSAILFFYFAAKVKHRAYHGEPNSIWAIAQPKQIPSGQTHPPLAQLSSSNLR